jgi:hypothetical protein
LFSSQCRYQGQRLDTAGATKEEDPNNCGAVKVWHALLEMSAIHQGLTRDMTGDIEAVTVDWITALVEAKKIVKTEWVGIRKRLDTQMDVSN